MFQARRFGLTRCSILAILSTVLFLVSCSSKHPDAPSLSAEESLRSMHVTGAFHVELFASEPLVSGPLEMVFDETGKVYVCGILDYPDDPPQAKPVRARIW